jgi:amino acid adenylation domain-containing protein
MGGSIAPDAMARTAETRGDAAVGRSIGDRFDEVAAANRRRIAILTPRGEIRYGALASLSDRIAFDIGKRFAARRAGPAPIAVLLPQGIAAIAAQLAILKAGACYVPLDPRHPAAHLRQTIGHAEASLVITDSKLADLAARVVGDARAVVDVDDLPRRGWGGAKPPRVAADSLAYVYYTSGTTGRPKGVADSHRNVLHNVQRYARTLGIGRSDRLSLIQSPSFSGAVSSTYAALLSGGTLCAYDLHADGPAGLADWLAEANVTIYHSVPALFRALLAGRREFPAMRIVRLEGDRALGADAAIFRATFPASSVLVNGLGTTETGIVRQFFVSRDTPVEDGLLPVGYPVPDVDVFIVDEAGRRVGHGVAGEIVVQSRFLAVGYWNDPRRTADKFSLVNDESGERTYRTGDLGRMRVDGCLVHLGRCDDVFKIRGQSVDPSIVEAALVGISGVADAAAVTRRGGDGESELVAIVVPRAGERPTLTQIGTGLRERLLDYMVPTAMIVRDALPVTGSGKVDRAAIALLAADPGPPPECGPNLPRTVLEMEIAAIWRDVLACDAVPGDVAFLEMGGNSLQAMQILVHLRERLGVDMSTADFLALPTVASQARFVETRAPDPSDARSDPS